MNSRPFAHAGRFYPADKNSLLRMFAGFKERFESRHFKNILGVGIVPHAGIVYSGFTAMQFFLEAKNIDVERVVIIGPSHHHLFSGFALSGNSIWQTILGDIQVDSKFNKLLESDFITINDKIHSDEHSIEVQTLFVKYAFKESVKIVPIIMGRQNIESVNLFVSKISPEMREKTLFVASSDMYHGYDYEKAKRVDFTTIKEILKNDESGFMKYFYIVEEEGGCAACGGGPIGIIISITRKGNGHLSLISHTTSSDVTGDFEGYSVGYSSFIGVENEERK
ncbi:MAG: AmmeMemoRadiSam system protein B [bacterium (Candidatus Stahlbacteria) CG23_combo_of_CG06-09_8_20_14_all_34_7]|nr:MAG: AmmeMemoRadiSam system protein B [bacterium (Candidatus Stahlbacteria) CG23_combo_of_CG06-09_8_20_14_all_34_7]